MATRVGNESDLVSTTVSKGEGTKGRFVVWQYNASLLDQELDHYLMTAWDSGLPGRRYWIDTEDSNRLRPAASGVYGPRVVLARW